MRQGPAPALAPFGCVRAHELAERPIEQSWLIEGLWADAGVGAIGGCPKSSKSWLALDMAVSVASGTPCLGRFAVSQPGSVLLYAAEDPLATVRSRLAGLCQYRGLDLWALEVHVITEPVIRLDTADHQARLRETAAGVRPRLLIIDPLVRVYGKVDENSASEMSALLGYLRGIQREFDVAVVLVHHARKGQAGDHEVGQALRGSGDLHAWVDSLLYLKRTKEGLRLSIEHRSAPSPDALAVALVESGSQPPHLEPVDSPRESQTPGMGAHLLSLLTRAPAGLTIEEVRLALGIRKASVVGLLHALERGGHVARDGRGWRAVIGRPCEPDGGGQAAPGGARVSPP